MARTPTRHPDNDEHYAGHVFAAPPGRHGADDELRAAGLSIHARPPYPAEAVWRYGDVLMGQAAALEMVRRARAKAMEAGA